MSQCFLNLTTVTMKGFPPVLTYLSAYLSSASFPRLFLESPGDSLRMRKGEASQNKK